MDFDINKLKWTRKPADYTISKDKIEVITNPHTDLWQRTYYHFRNDNAPVLQMETDKKFFSFTVKTVFESKHRFDQCGIVMYLDSENWLKGSIPSVYKGTHGRKRTSFCPCCVAFIPHTSSMRQSSALHGQKLISFRLFDPDHDI